MKIGVEELDFQHTKFGDLMLRRRHEVRLGGKLLYEVKLGDEFLMSSLFTDGETALARLGLAALGDGPLDVVVGGLGLGYTAAAALDNPAVQSLLVIDALSEVIGWHERALVPLGETLTADPRCRFVHADFFELASAPDRGFDDRQPGRRFDALLLDIDHAPGHWLQPDNATFYSTAGLRQAARQLRAGGVFALWSNDRTDDAFLATLGTAFKEPTAHVVEFANPYSGGTSTNTVYVART